MIHCIEYCAANTRFSRTKFFVIFVKGHMITNIFFTKISAMVWYYHETEPFHENFDPQKFAIGAIIINAWVCLHA